MEDDAKPNIDVKLMVLVDRTVSDITPNKLKKGKYNVQIGLIQDTNMAPKSIKFTSKLVLDLGKKNGKSNNGEVEEDNKQIGRQLELEFDHSQVTLVSEQGYQTSTEKIALKTQKAGGASFGKEELLDEIESED